ncbi:class I SAM-dependent methyltransferase [Natrinema ejinorense]|uniref:Methyltransferase type 11 n=1 Tax=Natrinema ejinorense TaxID=373386 RepID=A0A2A5QYV1_9EURY|nr:class I SAM-dependent methyltransferase [Natrinema ejinorense]PCR92011.1 methyltransferase type 11 [Natrinema ejinorense]
MERADSEPAGSGLADPLGRAMLAHHRDTPGRLTYRDGADVQDGNVAEFYFSSPDSWNRETIDVLERLTDHEPILDVGCGAGKHLLWWADRGADAIGVDASPNAVRTARERGLEDVLVGDMFDLPIETGAFGAVHAVGTQIGLGRSLAGIREVLAEFARVTADGGVAVVDNYDPTRLDEDFFGYRSDPREGIAHRCFHLEFERETEDGEQRREVGRTLQFLLCSPVRLREATTGTPWQPCHVARTDGTAHYRTVLKTERRPSAGTE